MVFEILNGSGIYSLLFIPILIFLARIADVSMGTIRVIFIAKGFKYLAPILGFFEVMIWLMAVRELLLNLSQPIYYIAYAGGFAAGTFMGIYIEEKISMGKVVLRIVTEKDSYKLLKTFKKEGYVVTSNGATGPDGKVNVIFTILKRHDAHKAIKIMQELSPDAFYSIEDIRFSLERVPKMFRKKNVNNFGSYRKEK
jgi:uncharacterized protein YebE (UPF0316 family)